MTWEVIPTERKFNMAAEKYTLTHEGLEKLQNEYQELKTVKRKEVADKIKEAREQGDLSENAEYDAAKDEQAKIEYRISELEQILSNYEVHEDKGGNTIDIGWDVTLLDVEFDEELNYKIVGSVEADILANKISADSPVGKAIIGKKKGQDVQVTLPNGENIVYKIVKATKSKEK